MDRSSTNGTGAIAIEDEEAREERREAKRQAEKAAKATICIPCRIGEHGKCWVIPGKWETCTCRECGPSAPAPTATVTPKTATAEAQPDTAKAATGKPNLYAIIRNPDIKAGPKVVFGVVISHLGRNDKCWLSIPTIALESGLLEAAVRRALKWLTCEDQGYLEIKACPRQG